MTGLLLVPAPGGIAPPIPGADDFANPAMVASVLGGAVFLLFAFGLLTFIVTRFLYICPPNEVFVFSGRSHTLSDGSRVGFKVVHGGRALRIPFLETFSRMDVRLYAVEVHVMNAFSRGGIPLVVHAIANVKIATDPVRVRQAIQNFLGVDTKSVLQVARQTLEGVLRETLAQLTPEEVNQNRLKFAEALADSAKDDFDKLGLELDVLKIQHVSDEQQYLQDLGRAQIASMLRDAENAENEAMQMVVEAQAAAHQHAETAQRQAEGSILQRRNMLRGEVAKLNGNVQSIENEAKVAAETARATAEQELQALRAELTRLQLAVDQVLPAEAQARAAQARARGEAATEVEQGKAAAEALRLVAEEWRAAGELARDAFVLRELAQLVEAANARASQLQVEELQLVDGGDGEALATMVASHPRLVARVLDEMGTALGVDLTGIVHGGKGASGPGAGRALAASTDSAPKTSRTGAPPFLPGGSR